MNDFRDIFIEVFEPIKEVQADLELEESSKCTYIWLVWPLVICILHRTIQPSSCVLKEDVDGLLPPQVHSVAKPGEDGRKDTLVGGEVEREAPATGGIVTIVIYHWSSED